MENRADFFKTERNERVHIMTAELDDYIGLPLTVDGFEALIERATDLYSLPKDDSIRSVLAGYVHHTPNDQHLTTITKIAAVLYKSIANALTWKIDQEIKAKNRAAIETEKAKFAADMEAKRKLEAITKAEAKRQRKGAPLKMVEKASPSEKSQ